jgi:hypothetical protein
MCGTKSKRLIATLFGVVLLSGCVSPSGDFCDVSRPIYIDSEAVVDWLVENDEALLRDVVSHNEMTAKCP